MGDGEPGGETIWAITTRMDPSREWGRTLQMTPEVTARAEQIWQTLGL